MKTAGRVIDLSRGWSFARGKAGRAWLSGSGTDDEAVNLPHCWNSTDAFQEGIEYYRGYGSYRTQFEVEDGAARWFLESEGFYGTGTVWLNGRKLAKIDGRYLGISLDVTGQIRAGAPNVLAILLTNKCSNHVLPGIKMPDFLLHGGLSGRVWLRKRPAQHIDPKSVQITCPDSLAQTASVRCSCDIGGEGSASIRWTLHDAEGSRITHADGANTELAVQSPSLWSPSSPYLYEVRCELVQNDDVVDCITQRIGLRQAEFRADGFYLNGKRLQLRGFNRHESMPGFGSALHEGIHELDARLIKETGANVVRLSHYPQHPAFLSACDRLGVMVYAELASWKSVRTGRWLNAALLQMEGMVRRDRNHPSVILWGLGNEARSLKAYTRLKALVRSLDARPVTYAENHLYRAERKGTTGIPDVWGNNYELDVLEDIRATDPGRSILMSECSNLPTTERGSRAIELEQVELIRSDLAAVAGTDYICGYIHWCMNDYATLRKQRYMRYSGVFDAWRVPKPARAFLQAMWLDRPFIKLYADWSANDVEKERSVHIFTNCDSFELIRNGETVYAGKGAFYSTASVEFGSGSLIARGTSSGSTVEDRIQSYGSAVAVDVAAGAVDGLVTVNARVVDEAGVTVSDWSGELVVEFDGPVSSRAYTPSGVVPVREGIARTFGVADAQGSVSITAKADGLTEGSASVSV